MVRFILLNRKEILESLINQGLRGVCLRRACRQFDNYQKSLSKEA